MVESPSPSGPPSEPSPSPPRCGDEAPHRVPAPAERRSISRLAIASFVLGGLLILWAILTVSAAGYGTNVRSEFSNRRPYDQIKREVHSAVPKAFVRALLGGWLIFMGVRSVKRGRS